MNDLRKIKEGMSGSEAAQAIYNNDKELLLKVEACEGALETYKAYANQLAVSGDVVAQVVQSSGYDPEAVMSQKAVTNMFDEYEGVAFLSESGISDSVIDVPETPLVNATYAIYASSDTEGHSLTEMYYNMQALGTRIKNLEKLFDRVGALEEKMKRVQENIREIQEFIINLQA